MALAMYAPQGSPDYVPGAAESGAAFGQFWDQLKSSGVAQLPMTPKLQEYFAKQSQLPVHNDGSFVDQYKTAEWVPIMFSTPAKGMEAQEFALFPDGRIEKLYKTGGEWDEMGFQSLTSKVPQSQLPQGSSAQESFRSAQDYEFFDFATDLAMNAVMTLGSAYALSGGSIGADVGSSAPQEGGFDPNSGAGEFGQNNFQADPLLDPATDYANFDAATGETVNPGGSPAPTGGVDTTSALTGPAASVGAPLAGSVLNDQINAPENAPQSDNSTALSRLLAGAGTSADWASILGTLGATGLGIYASDQQSDSLERLANQYMAMGAPSRARYESSFAPGFTMANDPGYTDALNQTAKSTLHGMSAKFGNPSDSPNAWDQTLTDLYQKTAYPALQNYRGLNANAGGISTFAGAAPSVSTGAINAERGIYDSIGAGAADIFNPPKRITLQDLLRQYG